MATALSELGHEVHVITEGLRSREGRRNENGATVHELPIICSTNRYSEYFRNLDGPLTYSQGVYEFLVRLGREERFDIIDFPLRGAEGFVSLQYHPGPIVVSLHTASVQLAELEGRQPNLQERALAGLESECLAQAAGILSHSYSTLEEIERLYGFRRDAKPTRIVPHGLPPLPGMNRRKIPGQERSSVEALVIGRLELRKGTRLLFDVLPGVLRQEARLRVRFVGVDDSTNEGFDELTGTTYPEYFRQRFPDLADRVLFEKYGSDECLRACYAEADFLLLPSLHESNGQILLEAMRSALPTITFENGVTREIFARDEFQSTELIFYKSIVYLGRPAL